MPLRGLDRKNSARFAKLRSPPPRQDQPWATDAPDAYLDLKSLSVTPALQNNKERSYFDISEIYSFNSSLQIIAKSISSLRNSRINPVLPHHSASTGSLDS